MPLLLQSPLEPRKASKLTVPQNEGGRRGFARREGGGGDLSPWCPGSLAGGWRKGCSERSQCRDRKSKHRRPATLAHWGGGARSAGPCAHLSSPINPLPPLRAMASWTFGPQCPEREWVEGLGTCPIGDTSPVPRNLSPPYCPTPSLLPRRCQENLRAARPASPSQQQELGGEVTFCQRRPQQCHPPPGPRGTPRCPAQVSAPLTTQPGSEGG